MTADVAYIAKFDGEIVTRLPLDIQGVVDGVGKFVGAGVVDVPE